MVGAKVGFAGWKRRMLEVLGGSVVALVAHKKESELLLAETVTNRWQPRV